MTSPTLEKTVYPSSQLSETEELAKNSYKHGRFEEAVKHFTTIISNSKEHKDVEWFIKRCDCYQHINEDDKAMNDANMVVELSPESYKGYLLLGTLHQVQGRYDKALFCYFDCLEIICKRGLFSSNIMEKCLDCIIQTAHFIATLSGNISKNDIHSQLYMLGNGLRREAQYMLAIKALKVGLIFCENYTNLTSDESMRMKIYFALAQCQQEIGKFEEAINNFKSSLGTALTIGDVSFETKAYICLSSLCSDQHRHAEAASYYIKLLAVGEDVLLALGENKKKFREHWPMDMETNILLNLCIAFKTLRLYDEALIYAKKYANSIKLSTSATMVTEEDSVSINSCETIDLIGLLQSRFILGDLHELKGDLDQALLFYEECAVITKTINEKNIGVDDSCLLDSASALSCKGNILMKKKKFESALHCFVQQSQIAKLIKIPELLLESSLSRGDALASIGRLGEAHDVYNYALNLHQKSIEDVESECMCMWKIASVYAAEHHYTTAAYYCEQAVALADKCPRRSVKMKLKFELALYYQHSSLPEELQKAFRILYHLIGFQEEHIFFYKMNGGKYFFEEENMLEKCYDAIQFQNNKSIQLSPYYTNELITTLSLNARTMTSGTSILHMTVVLHKLGNFDASASFGEAWRRRNFVCRFSFDAPQIPDMPLDLKIMEDHAGEQPLDEAFEKSDDARTKLQLIHHQRFLPKNMTNDALVLTFALCDEGILSQIIKPGIGVVYSYLSSEHNPDLFSIDHRVECLLLELDQNHTIPHKQLNEKLSALEELYNILLKPFENRLQKLSSTQHVVIVCGKHLKKVPFLSLRNPETGCCLGKRFRVSLSPCTYLVETEVQDSFQSFPRVPDNEHIIKSLESSGLSSSISHLVTKAATQTSILTSPRYEIPFKQKTEQQTCCVIGCPELPPVIKYGDGIWRPRTNPTALSECKKVSEYLGTSPHLGKKATKLSFMKKLQCSNILHVVSFGDMERGVMALAPDPFPKYGTECNMVEESYLLTKYDIESLNLNNLRLLVLNSGSNLDLSLPSGKSEWITLKNAWYLPELFLAAGASSIVCQLWNVPSMISQLFFSHFYLSLQSGNLISKAMDEAKTAVSNKYSDHRYWAGFLHLGVDKFVDLSEIRKSQLHFALNFAEKHRINPEPPFDEMADPERVMENLQRHISRLSYKIVKNSVKTEQNEVDNLKIVTALIELLEEAMDRLTADSNTNRPLTVLSESVKSCEEAVDLLEDLDFDFQDASIPHHASVLAPTGNMKAVVFPYWNKNEMLLPMHQALTGLQDICSSGALRYIVNLLPLSQDLLRALIDLMAITRHTPNVLLRVQEEYISCLWQKRFVRQYLCAIGFSQVHEFIVFFKTSKNRTLLVASLQLLASVCLHRNQSILEELNVESVEKTTQQSIEMKINSLNHAILPGNEVVLLSSWKQQNIEQEDETNLKRMANQLVLAKSSYKLALQRVKWWYNNLQAQIKLLEIESNSEKACDSERPKLYMKNSKNREISDFSGPTVLNSMTKVVEKRERAYSILQNRSSDAMSRFRNKVFKIYEKFT